MPVGYRLCKPRWAPNSPDAARLAGEGARRFGGRWNTAGVPAVYTSGSVALAVLEVLVHAQGELPDGLELWRVEIPIDVLEIKAPIESWLRFPYSREVQEMGDSALAGAAAVEVPSAVVPLEVNYILNPEHTEYPAEAWTLLGVFDFDYRLNPQSKLTLTHEG